MSDSMDYKSAKAILLKREKRIFEDYQKMVAKRKRNIAIMLIVGIFLFGWCLLGAPRPIGIAGAICIGLVVSMLIQAISDKMNKQKLEVFYEKLRNDSLDEVEKEKVIYEAEKDFG